MSDLFSPNIVINLAAQAGVRYSIENPDKYLKTNLLGFGNILEFCKNNRVENFIYASSSSVYGGNKNLPFKESHSDDHPINFYAATKRYWKNMGKYWQFKFLDWVQSKNKFW